MDVPDWLENQDDEEPAPVDNFNAPSPVPSSPHADEPLEDDPISEFLSSSAENEEEKQSTCSVEYSGHCYNINWRGWRRSENTHVLPKLKPGAGVLKMVELAARAIARNFPFEQVEQFDPPVPPELQQRIAFWSFPETDEDICVYTCLATSNEEEFLKGQVLFERDAVKDPIQIGFHLNANVEVRNGNVLNVSINFDRGRITSCSCTCRRPFSWCSHVVAVCLYRIMKPDDVPLRPPISESFTRLDRDQLQKFAQYLLAELPSKFMRKAQEILDSLLSMKPTPMNLHNGAPDPTAGAEITEMAAWLLDTTQLATSVTKMMRRFGMIQPTVISDVNMLNNNMPVTPSEYNQMMRPLKFLDPDPLWNLLNIVREMYKTNDRNALALLDLITEKMTESNQLIVWWFMVKTGINGNNGYQLRYYSANNNSYTSHTMASRLCDNVVDLWRLAALNPIISPNERVVLRVKFKEWHAKCIYSVFSNGSETNTNDADLYNFTGFKPAIEACNMSWVTFPIPGITYSTAVSNSRTWHYTLHPFTAGVNFKNPHYLYNPEDKLRTIFESCFNHATRVRNYVHKLRRRVIENDNRVMKYLYEYLPRARKNIYDYVHRMIPLVHTYLDEADETITDNRVFVPVNVFFSNPNKDGEEGCSNGEYGHGASFHSRQYCPFLCQQPYPRFIFKPGYCVTLDRDKDLAVELYEKDKACFAKECNVNEALLRELYRDNKNIPALKKECVARNGCGLEAYGMVLYRCKENDKTTNAAGVKKEEVGAKGNTAKKEQEDGVPNDDNLDNDEVTKGEKGVINNEKEVACNNADVGNGQNEFSNNEEVFAEARLDMGETTNKNNNKNGKKSRHKFTRKQRLAFDVAKKAKEEAGMAKVLLKRWCPMNESGAAVHLEFEKEQGVIVYGGGCGKKFGCCDGGKKKVLTEVEADAEFAGTYLKTYVEDNVQWLAEENNHGYPSTLNFYNALFDNVSRMNECPQKRLLARAEGLSAFGHEKEAIFIAETVAQDILANPPDYKTMCGGGSAKPRRRKGLLIINPMQHRLSRMAVEKMEMFHKLLGILTTEREHARTCFRLCLLALEMPRVPASIKPWEMQLQYFEFRIVEILKEIKPLTNAELKTLYEIALTLKKGQYRPRGNKLLPNLLMSFIIDALHTEGKEILDKARFAKVEEICFQAALVSLSTKSYVAEYDHTLLVEGLRRQKSELALKMLDTYKNDPKKLLRLMKILIDRELATKLHNSLRAWHYKDSSYQRIHFVQMDKRRREKMAEKQEKAKAKDPLKVCCSKHCVKNFQSGIFGLDNPNQHTMTYTRITAESMNSNTNKGRVILPLMLHDRHEHPHWKYAAQNKRYDGKAYNDKNYGHRFQNHEQMRRKFSYRCHLNNVSTFLSSSKHINDRFLSKKRGGSGGLFANRPSEAFAFSILDLAKSILAKSGVVLPSNLFHNVPSGKMAFRNAALHMCAFQLSMYGLAISNSISTTWHTRNFNPNASFVTVLVLEIGIPALMFMLDNWDGILTPVEVITLADKASRLGDPFASKLAAQLSLSTLSHSHELNALDVIRALNQCRDQGKHTLEKACTTIENVTKTRHVHHEIIFYVSKLWYEMYCATLAGPDGTVDLESITGEITTPIPGEDLVRIEEHFYDRSAEDLLLMAVGEEKAGDKKGNSGGYLGTKEKERHLEAARERYRIKKETKMIELQQAELKLMEQRLSYEKIRLDDRQVERANKLTRDQSANFNVDVRDKIARLKREQQLEITSLEAKHEFAMHKTMAIQAVLRVEYGRKLRAVLPEMKEFHQAEGRNDEAEGGVFQFRELEMATEEIENGADLDGKEEEEGVDKNATANVGGPLHFHSRPPIADLSDDRWKPRSAPRSLQKELQKKLYFLTASYRMGVKAHQMLTDSISEEKTHNRFYFVPKYAPDISRIMLISRKLGDAWLREYCAVIEHTVVNPFILFQVAVQAAFHFANYDPSAIMFLMRSEKCCHVLIEKSKLWFSVYLDTKMKNLSITDEEEYLQTLKAAKRAFLISNDDKPELFEKWYSVLPTRTIGTYSPTMVAF